MAKQQSIAISGAGRGIGRAIAKTFGRAGWTVFGVSRTQSDLEELQSFWQSQACVGKLHTQVADLSRQQGCEEWTDQIAVNVDQLDALVHNVGQFAAGTLLDGPADQLDTFLRINLLSAHYLSRALTPLLQAAETGYLLTIGSVATTDWPAPMASYAISKYALEGWHRVLCRELADTSIKCTLLRPGATFTSSWDGVPVDPDTLLAPQQIADWVLRRLTENASDNIEEITIRP